MSVKWLAAEVKAGKISWLLVDGSGSGGPTLPGDTRTGSRSALSVAEKVSTKVTLTSGAALYHLTGEAGAILAAAGEIAQGGPPKFRHVEEWECVRGSRLR